MDDQAIYDLLVELQDCFRGPVIDHLDDAVAIAQCAIPAGQSYPPSLVRMREALLAQREGLERLAGMIAVLRLRLDSAAREKSPC